MSKYVQGKDGKFAGSIGDGKSRVPTPSDAPAGLTPASETSTTAPAYSQLYAEYTAVARSSFPAGSAAARAHDPASTGADLDRIAFSTKDTAALEGVAEHANTMPSTLDHLSTLDPQEYPGVLARVAGNHRTSKDALKRLASPEMPVGVRCNVVWNPASTESVLDGMENDTDVNVLQGVADNANSGPYALIRLAMDPARGDEWVHTAAKANRAFPSVQKRVLIATDPGCPADVRALLMNDRSEAVRQAAAGPQVLPSSA